MESEAPAVPPQLAPLAPRHRLGAAPKALLQHRSEAHHRRDRQRGPRGERERERECEGLDSAGAGAAEGRLGEPAGVLGQLFRP